MLDLDDGHVRAVESRDCAGSGLFERLRQAATIDPALTLACLAHLESAAQRDFLLHEAFKAAMQRQPSIVRPYIGLVIDQPWVARAGYFPLEKLAQLFLESDAATARRLYVMAATYHPSVALREVRSYSGLSFGRDVFEAAALSAPGEAVGLACGGSLTGQAILEALRSSRHPELGILANLAVDASVAPIVRERATVFAPQIVAGVLPASRAIDLAGGNGYFPAVARLRIRASGVRAASLDRVLEAYAQILFRTLEDRSAASDPRELTGFSAGDLFLLLTYGRTEADDALFTKIFDRMLIPRMRASRERASTSALARLLNDVEYLNLRRFLTTAMAHQRLEQFLATAANETEANTVIARSIENLESAEEPVDAMLSAGTILDGVHNASRRAALRSAVLAQYNRAAQQRDASPAILYGLLAASGERSGGRASDAEFAAIAGRYRGYFEEPGSLNTNTLFDAGGICIQQHFFYDDEDGVASFNSFHRVYQNHADWKWQDHGSYVQVSGAGRAGRRIEMFANVPTYPPASDAATRRHVLTKMLAERGLTPTVIVHRGHAFFFEQSLQYLTNSARLVYLGSCRGLENVHSVVSVAGRAQIIVTRSVGTEIINDPLLKAINDELLLGKKTLDWEPFWRTLSVRFGGSPLFRDYIPPPRNAAAILLSAYYAALASGDR